MTRIFERAAADFSPDKPVTHAFVIGVGGYPKAKVGQGVDHDFHADDLPSAADSARFFCDWLVANQDNLIAPLASLELLVSETAEGGDRYQWAPPVDDGGTPIQIASATSDEVDAAGTRWLEQFETRPGDIALLFCCGHGASLSSEPVLFLADLNADKKNPWSFININSLGRALRKDPNIGSAYLFADACGETIAGFELAKAQDVRFWAAPVFGALEAQKVLLLCAAPAGLLAYDGAMPGGDVRLGRFTQTLVKALNGASISRWQTGWAVSSSGLRDDLKMLRQFYFAGWEDQAFEPASLMSFNDVRHLVRPDRPVIPIIVSRYPQGSIDGFSCCIIDQPPQPPPPVSAPLVPFDQFRLAWRAEMTPRKTSAYATLFTQNSLHFTPFTPDRPHFDLQVEII